MSDTEYRSVLAIVDKWRALPQPSYRLNDRTCVSFVADIASALNLRAELPADLLRKPKAFLDRVSQNNAQLIARRSHEAALAFQSDTAAQR